MRYKISTCLIFLLIVFSKNSNAQWVTIQDSNFVTWLNNNGYSSCMNGNQLNTSCSLVTSDTSVVCNYSNIFNLQGIQYFISLTELRCQGNYFTTIPPLPANLKTLDCSNGQVGSLPSLPGSLRFLSCADNQISVIPSLPGSLTYLDVSSNQISNLPALPGSLKALICDWNLIATLPALPNSLKVLSCSTNPITILVNLPDSLIQLDCYNCLLTDLPPLPDPLKILSCSDNQLTSLPALPNSLSELYCQMNLIGSLPALPASLTSISCFNNLLLALPTLSDSLTLLYCSDNQLLSLPPFPSVMSDLDVSNNPALTCLPPIQIITNSISFSGTNITCLPNAIQHPNTSFLPAIDTMPICDLSFNPNNCELGYNIKGKVQSDFDQDCSTNDGTTLHGIQISLIDTGANLISTCFTNYSGQFTFDSNQGTFKISVDTLLIPFSALCPDTANYVSSITPANPSDYNLDFNLKCKYDLAVSSIVRDSGIVRPAGKSLIQINAGDFAKQFGSSCINNSGGNLKVIINGTSHYDGVAIGSLSPSLINGDTLIWLISDWSVVSNNSFHIRLKTNTSAAIGSPVCFTVIINGDFAENNLSNNVLTQCFYTVSSYDPNIKEVYPEYPEHAGDWLTYTIHFQNTGTASAENIEVLDTLDSNLDWSNFRLLAASHENITEVFNVTGIIKFNFPNINLADSFSNEPASHGWIQYKIKMKDDLVPPIEIHNSAAIYFDFNLPVITNDAIAHYYILSDNSEIEQSLQINLFPNPASNELNIESNCMGCTLKVFDVNGRLIEAKTFSENLTRLSVQNWSDGVYLLEIIQQQNVWRSKFIHCK